MESTVVVPLDVDVRLVGVVPLLPVGDRFPARVGYAWKVTNLPSALGTLDLMVAVEPGLRGGLNPILKGLTLLLSFLVSPLCRKCVVRPDRIRASLVVFLSPLLDSWHDHSLPVFLARRPVVVVFNDPVFVLASVGIYAVLTSLPWVFLVLVVFPCPLEHLVGVPVQVAGDSPVESLASRPDHVSRLLRSQFVARR